MVAAMAKHGGATATVPGSCLYHVTSSTTNPMAASDLGRYMYQHFSRWPLVDKAGRPILVQPPSALGSMEELVRYVQRDMEEGGNAEDMPPSLQRERRRLHAMAMEKQLLHLSRVYEPYTFCGGRFDSANTEALFAEMSAQEREMFQFDVRSIDWMDYITNVHIPGLRKHVLKGRGDQHAVSGAAS